MALSEELVVKVVEGWVADARLTPIDGGMNSSVWRVEAPDGQAFVAKAHDVSLLPGLEVARHLADRGFDSGAPIHTLVDGVDVVALLRVVPGEPLTWRDDLLIGQTLRRAHDLLRDFEAPVGLARWPWRWLDVAVIVDEPTRALAEAALADATRMSASVDSGTLHGDPATEAFLRDGDRVGLIDWGSAMHGPLLYDLASALMYADPGVIEGYGGANEDEVSVFLRYRFAVQAWYFADRIAKGITTGSDDAENTKGFEDSKRMLASGIERGGRLWGAPTH